jgi:hypothetical protein
MHATVVSIINHDQKYLTDFSCGTHAHDAIFADKQHANTSTPLLLLTLVTVTS